MQSGLMKLLTKESWLVNVNQQDNIDSKKEAQLRKESIKFINTLGVDFLRLPVSTVQKAIVIFQRYCQSVSFKNFDRFLTGTVSLLLMAKDDYQQKRLEDTIKSFLIVAQRMRLQQVNKYVDPHRLDTREQQEQYLAKLGPKAVQLQIENFQNAEIEILQMTGYDLTVEVSSKYLDIFKSEKFSNLFEDQVIFSDLLVLAQENAEFIYMPNLCLYYHPIILTIVAIQAASEKLRCVLPKLPSGQEWWTLFSTRINPEDINDCMFYFHEFMKQIA